MKLDDVLCSSSEVFNLWIDYEDFHAGKIQMHKGACASALKRQDIPSNISLCIWLCEVSLGQRVLLRLPG